MSFVVGCVHVLAWCIGAVALIVLGLAGFAALVVWAVIHEERARPIPRPVGEPPQQRDPRWSHLPGYPYR